MNLEQRRANVRRAYEEKVQDVAFFGDAPSGMKGLVNSDQVDKVVPNKWFDGASTTTDEMLEILNEAPTRIVNGSNQGDPQHDAGALRRVSHHQHHRTFHHQ